MESLKGIEYLRALNPDGTPDFTPNESEAGPLFHDYLAGPTGTEQPADCMGELGVEWNPFVKRWVMLYNCRNDSPANPRGIYMRVAPSDIKSRAGWRVLSFHSPRRHGPESNAL
jgi:hypothetical protein